MKQNQDESLLFRFNNARPFGNDGGHLMTEVHPVNPTIINSSGFMKSKHVIKIFM